MRNGGGVAHIGAPQGSYAIMLTDRIALPGFIDGAFIKGIYLDRPDT